MVRVTSELIDEMLTYINITLRQAKKYIKDGRIWLAIHMLRILEWHIAELRRILGESYGEKEIEVAEEED